MKKTLFGLLLAALLVSFMMMPSLQGLRNRADDQITISPNDTMRDLQVKIQKMREQLRRDGETFEVGLNPAMQYPLEQLCGLKEELAPANVPVMELPTDVQALPTSYTGIYTSIKNQGSCGSCWDFSTTGTAEGVLKKLSGTTYDLSEQYALDCNTDGWNCSGGWYVFNMFCAPYGGRAESCYPYTAVKGTCKSTCGSVATISGYAQVCGSSSVCATTDIKNAIYNYGLVSVAVYADTTFQSYTSGCFSRNTGSGINHAVCLVGWNDTTPCSTGAWYLKNSWGTGWGISGFMWIKYGVMRVGYRTTYAW
ncbi:MAG: C1 family peptidase [Candidatus Omnitrophota bacterium]